MWRYLIPKIGMFFWDGLFSGIGSIGASLIGGLFGMEGQESANEANASMAQKQMDFQERMYKNRHTYEVADLRNAGLNPILSANSAASAPMGAQAVMQNTQEQLGQGISNSGRVMADIMLARNSAKLAGEKAKTEQTQQKLNKAQEDMARIAAVMTGVNAQKAASELPGKQAEAVIMSGPKGVFFKSMDMFKNFILPWTSSANKAKGGD